MASSTNTWASLRQQTRSAESQTDTLFHKYSQFNTPSSISPKPSDEETSIESQIGHLLDRRESLINQLSNLLDSESALTSSALKQNNLSRHREVLSEHRKELQRIKATIAETRNRANLLSNVRSDISAYHSANPAQAESDYMLQERGRLDDSHRGVDGILSQAHYINEAFESQRETLAGIQRRIAISASQLPGINTVIGKISSKRLRDSIILAVFIAFCFLMMIYFR